MSEGEAPYWAAFLTAIKTDDLNGLGELVVSTLINALVEHEGLLARPLLPAEDVYAYLKARADKDLAALKALSNSSSETLVTASCSGPMALRIVGAELWQTPRLRIFQHNDDQGMFKPGVYRSLAWDKGRTQ